MQKKLNGYYLEVPDNGACQISIVGNKGTGFAVGVELKDGGLIYLERYDGNDVFFTDLDDFAGALHFMTEETAKDAAREYVASHLCENCINGTNHVH